MESSQNLKVQVPDYSVSNKISLQAGQNFVTMERAQSLASTEGRRKLTKIDMACSVTNLEQPYNKTRVIRIVQRYVLINKLSVPIVIN